MAERCPPGVIERVGGAPREDERAKRRRARANWHREERAQAGGRVRERKVAGQRGGLDGARVRHVQPLAALAVQQAPGAPLAAAHDGVALERARALAVEGEQHRGLGLVVGKGAHAARGAGGEVAGW